MGFFQFRLRLIRPPVDAARETMRGRWNRNAEDDLVVGESGRVVASALVKSVSAPSVRRTFSW